MSMSALPTWTTPSEPDAETGANADRDARTPGTASPWLLVLPLGAAALSAAMLLRKPAVRRAASEVVRDAEVRDVCKDAGQRAYRVIADSWRRHGGPDGLAETFLR